MNGSCLRLIHLSKVLLYKWHSLVISLFINSVPLSVTRISGKPNFAIQCSENVVYA